MSINKKILGPLQDELLHSFILRVLLRSGYSDFSTILTSGGWGHNPSVPFLVKSEFEVFCRRDLVRVFEMSTVCEKMDNIFGVHFSHLLPFEKSLTNFEKSRVVSFRKVFYPEKNKCGAGQSMAVKYCMFCIHDQIKQYGFAYFKSDWSYHAHCEIHGKQLLTIKTGNGLSSMLEDIKLVLRGKIPVNSQELDYADDNHHDNRFSPSRFLKISPCAKHEIVNHLLMSCGFYKQGYRSVADYGLLNANERLVFSKWQLREEVLSDIETYYEAALEKNYEDCMVFLNDKLKIINVQYFDDMAPSDERWLLKSKARDCFKCTASHNIGLEQCSASQLIFSTKAYKVKFNHDLDITTPCAERLRELHFSISLHQRANGVEQGEKAVKSQVERAELRRMTGGVNAMMEMRSRSIVRKNRTIIDR